jgi:cyclophilin family peptidyl-prolyl cis-trans isomerase
MGSKMRAWEGTVVGRGRWLAVLTMAALVAMAIAATTAIGGSKQEIPESTGGCTVVAGGRTPSHHLKAPPQTVTRGAHLVAIVETTCGRFQIKLDARQAPRIVNSFVYLARSGFYDGLLFYRVVPNFVIQGGDPTNNGVGGPGYRVTEQPPAGFHYRLGTVAMAKAARERSGEAGSTFFVVIGQGQFIKDEYAILGRVSAGLATVERIGALGTMSESPRLPIRIEAIRIKGHGS